MGLGLLCPTWTHMYALAIDQSLLYPVINRSPDALGECRPTLLMRLPWGITGIRSLLCVVVVLVVIHMYKHAAVSMCIATYAKSTVYNYT